MVLFTPTEIKVRKFLQGFFSVWNIISVGWQEKNILVECNPHTPAHFKVLYSAGSFSLYTPCSLPPLSSHSYKIFWIITQHSVQYLCEMKLRDNSTLQHLDMHWHMQISSFLLSLQETFLCCATMSSKSNNLGTLWFIGTITVLGLLPNFVSLLRCTESELNTACSFSVTFA